MQATEHATDGNFAAALERAALAHPERSCLILPGHDAWRYADLVACGQRMAGALRDLGVRAGDRVLVQVDKSPEAVALYLACLRAGAVFVPLNTAYTSEEVRYFLDDCEPALVVCRSVDLQARQGIAGAVPLVTLGSAADGSLMTAFAAARPAPEIEARAASDLAAIVYTSGTTGRSKGAMLTHGNLASNARVLVELWGWRDDDVLLHALPIFHVHGLFVALHCALLTATPMIFLPQFETEAVLSALARATVMMGVPTFYTRLLERQELDERWCAGVRLFISGSAPLTEQTFAAWEARTGQRILERYGMSETMMNTSNPLVGERVAGTVGFALPGVEVRIADDVGVPSAVGEVGVIEVRGPNVFAGYWRMPDKTAEEFRADGFFVTGDLGRMDAAGRLAIVGRAKDLIISGGYNIYPKEIERLLDEIAGVRESAVIGVPHADFGEAVVAVLVPEDGDIDESVVRRALEGRLARFKQPKAVINLPALPRNAMGKVQKSLLRAHYGALFGEAS